MSSDEIIKEIENKGKARLAELQKQCESQLNDINATKEGKIKELQAEWEKKTSEDLKNLEKRGEDESLLEYRSIIMDRKSSLIREFMENIQSMGEKIRKLPEYESLIEKSVETCLKELGAKCTVRVCSKDKKIITKIDGDFKTEETKDEQIGIIATSKDGKRTLDLTLNSVLNEKKEDLEEKLVSLMGAD